MIVNKVKVRLCFKNKILHQRFNLPTSARYGDCKSLYCSKMRSRKWYHHIVGYLVSLALINSFTVQQQIGGTGTSLDFQFDVCHCLLKADQPIESDEDVANLFSQSRSLTTNQVSMPLCYDSKPMANKMRKSQFLLATQIHQTHMLQMLEISNLHVCFIRLFHKFSWSRKVHGVTFWISLR